MNRKNEFSYDHGYEQEDFDEFDEDEKASDAPLGEIADSILTEDGALRLLEVGAGAPAQSENSQTDLIDAGSTIIAIDPPRFSPDVRRNEASICEPHSERVGVAVSAERVVHGTGFCGACFNGSAIDPAELIGEVDDDDRHVRHDLGFRRRRVQPRSGERERAALRRYWQKNRAAIMERRRARLRARHQEQERR
jgi:hypothetical protein